MGAAGVHGVHCPTGEQCGAHDAARCIITWAGVIEGMDDGLGQDAR